MTRTFTLTASAVAIMGLSLAPSAAQRTIDLDDLENNPGGFIGQQISVEGEVQEVMGPRVFSIDEDNWVDFDGETLVYMKAPRVASLDDNDEIRVTGTVQHYTTVQSDIDREWGWPDVDPDWTTEMNERPVIVADSVTSIGNDNRLDWGFDDPNWDDGARMADPNDSRSGDPAITSLGAIAGTVTTASVGTAVELDRVRVHSAAGEGYWIGSENEKVFILPSDSSVSLAAGDMVTVHGTVMSLPRDMREKIGSKDEHIYVYATTVTKS